VEVDCIVQCHLVLDIVLLSVIVLPLHLEGTRSEFESFLYLRAAFSVRKVRQRGEDLRPELVVGAFSRRIEGQIVAIGFIVALDEQRLIRPL
jgi:hypothetical protein